MTSTRITQLAVRIQENTLKIDHYMSRKGLPSPSFDEDGPVDFKITSPEIEEARMIAIDSTLELHQLLLGPALCLRSVVSMVQEAFHGSCSSCSLMYFLKVERYKPTSHLQIRHCLQDPCSRRGILRGAGSQMRPQRDPSSEISTLRYGLASSLSRTPQRLCQAYCCLSETVRRPAGTSWIGLYVRRGLAVLCTSTYLFSRCVAFMLIGLERLLRL